MIRWCLKLSLIVLAVTVLQVLLLKFLNPPFTVAMGLCWVKQKIGIRDYVPSRYQWRPLNEISPHLKKAVLAAEDQRFLSHRGFDLIELKQAFRDIFAAKRIRGASTISMQTARLVFLWPDRSVLRKIAEAYYTVLVELLWSKERILEIYLNTVDWGRGIKGAEAAARIYFKTPAARLPASQSALLAAVLPSPHKWSPTHPSAYVRQRQRKIMQEMKKMPLL